MVRVSEGVSAPSLGGFSLPSAFSLAFKLWKSWQTLWKSRNWIRQWIFFWLSCFFWADVALISFFVWDEESFIAPACLHLPLEEYQSENWWHKPLAHSFILISKTFCVCCEHVKQNHPMCLYSPGQSWIYPASTEDWRGSAVQYFCSFPPDVQAMPHFSF